jgi:NitT/TauT family transport system substrate-binding protein
MSPLVRRLLGVALSVGVFAAACAPAAPAPTATTSAPAAGAATPAATSAGGQAAAKPGALKQIQVGLAGEGPQNGPQYIAQKQGYFAEQGLDVQLVPMFSGPQLEAAVVGGAATLVSLSSLTLARSVQKDVPLKAVIAMSQGNPFYIATSPGWAKDKGLTASSTPDQIAAGLKGAQLAITAPGGSTDVVARVFLSKRNLAPDKDVTFVTVPANGMLTAVENGRVDAMVNSAPDPQTVAKDGGIAWSLDQAPEFHGMVYDQMVTSQSTIQQDPKTVQGYVAALVKAWQFTRQNPEQAFGIVKAAAPGGDTDAFKASYDEYQKFAKAGPVPSADAYQKAMDVYKASGSGATDIPMDKMWDLQFAKAATGSQ